MDKIKFVYTDDSELNIMPLYDPMYVYKIGDVLFVNGIKHYVSDVEHSLSVTDINTHQSMIVFLGKVWQ